LQEELWHLYWWPSQRVGGRRVRHYRYDCMSVIDTGVINIEASAAQPS
jgi:hypothetical protein